MGYRISFEYMRREDPKGISKKGFPHGVICAVEIDGDENIYLGYSYCNPLDQFNRVTGRKLALTRAIEEMPRDERKAIWDAYFGRS